jgi:hypothetical protein
MGDKDKTGKNGGEKRASRYGRLGRNLFFFGAALAGFLFFLIQILNSYPFWDYINGYRLQLPPFVAIYGDIYYLPWPFQFLKFTQLFDIAVVLAFVGLFAWKLSGSGNFSRRTFLAASGYTFLVTGTICAVIVYLQIDVLTGTNLPWGSYAWGTERVAYNTQFLGAEYNCAFLNYTQLLYISVALAVLGFLLWNHFSVAERKTPSSLVVAGLFAASLALLISGLYLMFPGVKFTSPDPSMPATRYAVQGAMIVWTGAVFLMGSLIEFYSKLKETIEKATAHFKQN